MQLLRQQTGCMRTQKFLKRERENKHVAATMGHRGRVLVAGNNRKQHAEYILIQKMHRQNIRLKGAEIVVIRVRGPNNELAPSKPCAKCMPNIEKSGIKKVYHS